MKILYTIAVTFFLVGCRCSQPIAPLTAAQAQAVAMQLANEKADTLFHKRPFHDAKPAQFEAGRWTWNAGQGMGLGDFRAKVELAADGSTNSADVQLFNDVLIQ